MPKGLNKVQLIGYLGKTPELRFTPGGREVTDFSLATGRSYKDAQGNLVDETEWHQITCWGPLAVNVSQYLSKGRRVYVEGYLKTTTSGEGEDRKYYTKVVARDVIFLDSNNGGGAPQANVQPVDSQEEVPF